VGEFFSHLSESDANYNMFAFLEREGAQVGVDSISNLLLYWLCKAKLNQQQRKGLDGPYPDARWWHLVQRLANHWSYLKKNLLISGATRAYSRQFQRINEALGGHCHPPIDHKELAETAQPFYNPLTRGGEGHMEVGKSIYCTKRHLCHMVLSLKPFGCMPSTQSDGVMAAVTSRHEDILFLSIETSGDGDINAISRVQMMLADAKRRAQAECEQAYKRSGKRLEQIQDYVASHPELRRPSYRIPRQEGVTATAAHFILHVSDLMDKERFD
jgi:predicted nucleotide-binding protein (sugar kinase/HSP70/actin superfamily)